MKRSGKKKRGLVKAAGGLRVIALFEGAKGALVLLTGFGLLQLIHRDVHEVAAQLVRVLHLNPARHYPRIFLDLADRVTASELWALACGAFAYSAARLAEAVGLWFHRPWAEWFGLLSGGIYLPVEIYELLHRPTWPKATILAVNAIVVGYLLKEMRHHSR